jgi:hypothetical protein
MWVWELRGSRHFKPAAYSVQPQLPHRGELIIVSLGASPSFGVFDNALPADSLTLYMAPGRVSCNLLVDSGIQGLATDMLCPDTHLPTPAD